MLDDGTNALDQQIPRALSIGEDGLPVKRESEQDYVFGLVDRVLMESLEEGDFGLAWAALEKFRAMNKASSLGAAKLLHGVKNNWEKIESDETFEQAAVRATGYSKLTVQRYVDVWEFLTGDYIPEEFVESFENQTMRQLVKEASLVVTQGYELEHDDWRDLSEAIDEHRVADVAARVKGTERNKNHMSIKMDETGTIFAYRGTDEALIGHLRLSDKDPLVQDAIKRILSCAAITKREEDY